MRRGQRRGRLLTANILFSSGSDGPGLFRHYGLVPYLLNQWAAASHNGKKRI